MLLLDTLLLLLRGAELGLVFLVGGVKVVAAAVVDEEGPDVIRLDFID